MILRRGQIYFDESHIEALKEEPEYVRARYRAAANTLAPEPFGITREKAAEIIKRSLRQLYRILRRFKEDGIPGLRHRSKRPKTIHVKTPREIEEKVLAVRKATGFGPRSVSDLVNESLKREDRPEYVYPSLTYNILVREGR